MIDPLSDMERTILELDAIGLAAAEKFHGILIDERHVPQIQSQLLPRSLDGEQFLERLDILCFDPATECEQDLTILCSPSPQHVSSLCFENNEHRDGIPFFRASLNESRIEDRQLSCQW